MERLNEFQEEWLDATSVPLRRLTFEPFDTATQCILWQVRTPEITTSQTTSPAA